MKVYDDLCIYSGYENDEANLMSGTVHVCLYLCMEGHRG